MTAFLVLLKAKAAMIGGGVGLTLGLWAAKKWLPSLLRRFIAKEVTQALDAAKNPEDKELVLAVLKWVEAKLPGADRGKEKAAMAADKLIAIIPALASQKESLSATIEAVFAEAKDEIHKSTHTQ